jgi:hypothetical protein
MRRFFHGIKANSSQGLKVQPGSKIYGEYLPKFSCGHGDVLKDPGPVKLSGLLLRGLDGNDAISSPWQKFPDRRGKMAKFQPVLVARTVCS